MPQTSSKDAFLYCCTRLAGISPGSLAAASPPPQSSSATTEQSTKVSLTRAPAPLVHCTRLHLLTEVVPPAPPCRPQRLPEPHLHGEKIMRNSRRASLRARLEMFVCIVCFASGNACFECPSVSALLVREGRGHGSMEVEASRSSTMVRRARCTPSAWRGLCSAVRTPGTSLERKSPMTTGGLESLWSRVPSLHLESTGSPLTPGSTRQRCAVASLASIRTPRSSSRFSTRRPTSTSTSPGFTLHWGTATLTNLW